MATRESPVSLRPVQEYIGNRMKQIEYCERSLRESVGRQWSETRRLSHRAARTGVGLGAIALDQVAESVHSGHSLLDKAGQKGEQIERNLSTQVGDRVHELETRAGRELRRASVRLKRNPSVVSNERMNAQLDRVLAGIEPSHGQTDPATAPLAGYDELNVAEVNARLAGMRVDDLQSLRAYERLHKGRITVLQAVDQELEKKLAIV